MNDIYALRLYSPVNRSPSVQEIRYTVLLMTDNDHRGLGE